MIDKPELGMLVFLRSGSPPLTISDNTLDENIEVTWLDVNLHENMMVAPRECFDALPVPAVSAHNSQPLSGED